MALCPSSSPTHAHHAELQCCVEVAMAGLLTQAGVPGGRPGKKAGAALCFALLQLLESHGVPVDPPALCVVLDALLALRRASEAHAVWLRLGSESAHRTPSRYALLLAGLLGRPVHDAQSVEAVVAVAVDMVRATGVPLPPHLRTGVVDKVRGLEMSKGAAWVRSVCSLVERGQE
jgi:hypothetical protein